LFDGKKWRRLDIENVMSNLRGVVIEERIPASIFVEHGENIGEESTILATRRFEERRSFRLGKFRSLVEDALNSFPASAVHGAPEQ
jgi:hypothetical protein